MLPLSFADPGEEVLIQRVGGSPEVKKHLEDLGLVPGTEVTVITVLNGNLIVKVKESRVAIDERMAGKIMIIQEDGNEKSERGADRRHSKGEEDPWRRSGKAPHHGHGHH